MFENVDEFLLCRPQSNVPFKERQIGREISSSIVVKKNWVRISIGLGEGNKG